MAGVLRIEFPNRFSQCSECAHALGLAKQIDADKAESAARENEVPDPKAVVHCASIFRDKTHMSIALQLRSNTNSVIVGITDSAKVECPGKVAKLEPNQTSQLPS